MNPQNKPSLSTCIISIQRIFILVGILGLFSSNVEPLSQPASNQESPLWKMIKYKDLTKIKIESLIACSCEEGINMPIEDRRLYLFLENNLSGAIFLSKHVRVRTLILPAWVFSVKEGEMHDLKHFCVIRGIRTPHPDLAGAVRVMQRLLKKPSHLDCRALLSNLRNPGAHGRPHRRTALVLDCRNDVRSKAIFLTIHIINLGNAFL